MTDKKPSLAKVSTETIQQISDALGLEIVQLRREASAALESGHLAIATSIAADLAEKLDDQEKYLHVLENRAKRAMSRKAPDIPK